MAGPEQTDGRTDAELIAAAQRGDPAAIEAFLARFEAAIYRFGLRLCKHPEDAREVLQETLLAAARSLPAYRGDASVATWLYTIARSFCIKQRRHGRSVTVAGDASAGEVDEVVDPAAPPDEAAIRGELGETLARALDSLAPAYREVLVLRDVEGLTAPETASVLGIGVDAVKSRLHRARVAVRERLAPVLGEAPPPAPGCPDVANLFSRRLEGEVDAHLCEEMEHHLAGCPRCTAACDTLKRTLALCASTRDTPVPPEVQGQVRHAVHDLLAAGARHP